MSKLDTAPYKGVRDFYPEDMAIQNYMFETWKKVAKDFGYVEYGASILEPAELYKSKGNEEIINEQTFSFIDRGDREVVLRPEMTPTLARMVAAKKRELKFPLRWFSIPNLFRYERPQRGRKREHWQLNCDVLGIAGIEAEVEIIHLASNIMKSFGTKDQDFEIRINNRKLLQERFGSKLISAEKLPEALRLLDKKDKIEATEFDLEWKKLSNESFEVSHEANTEINGLISELSKLGIKNVVYDPVLTRGFDYYTGTVFEIYDTHPDNNRSLFGGGRYDNLLEIFGVEPVPTVGFGMGDITFRDFLETHKLGPYA